MKLKDLWSFHTDVVCVFFFPRYKMCISNNRALSTTNLNFSVFCLNEKTKISSCTRLQTLIPSLITAPANNGKVKPQTHTHMSAVSVRSLVCCQFSPFVPLLQVFFPHFSWNSPGYWGAVTHCGQDASLHQCSLVDTLSNRHHSWLTQPHLCPFSASAQLFTGTKCNPITVIYHRSDIVLSDWTSC